MCNNHVGVRQYYFVKSSDIKTCFNFTKTSFYYCPKSTMYTFVESDVFLTSFYLGIQYVCCVCVDVSAPATVDN